MKTIYILIALVIHVITFAQDDNPIFGAVQVTYSSHNNKEDSYYSYENERYLLWEESNGNIDFANVILVQNSHSMGSVTSIKVDKVNQFHTIYYFDWNYSNSYNEVKGVANVKFEIHKRKGVEEYDQAVVAITDSKGLNLLYKGNLVHYKNELLFHYNFKKAIDNQK